jgi:hypothetical protein
MCLQCSYAMEGSRLGGRWANGAAEPNFGLGRASRVKGGVGRVGDGSVHSTDEGPLVIDIGSAGARGQ